MKRADGEAMFIAPGQVAILRQAGAAVLVDGLVAEGGGPRADLQRGDRLVRFQEEAVGDLAAVMRAYKALPTGSMVTLELARDGRSVGVRFSKPETPAGPTMVVGSGGAAGAGAWTAASGSSSGGLSIAGAQVIENAQGMPEVSHRMAHPAAASVALRVGDVITAIDGRSIAALAGLEMLYARIAVGANVKLTVQRGGQSIEVAFTRPASP